MSKKKILKDLSSQYIGLLNYDTDESFSIETKVYEYLGYTLQSLLKVCQSSLYAKDQNIHYHRSQDLANILNLASNLIPMRELRLLDEILKKEVKKH